MNDADRYPEQHAADGDEEAKRIAAVAGDAFRLRLPVHHRSIHAQRHAYADDDAGILFMDQLAALIGTGKLVATIDIEGRPFREVTTFTVSSHKDHNDRRLIFWLSPQTTEI